MLHLDCKFAAQKSAVQMLLHSAKGLNVYLIN